MRVMTVVFLGACLPTLASGTTAKEFAWIERGESAVLQKLSDPESARFRNSRFHRGREGVPVTCGEVNAKNRMGGYVGYQQFISAGKPENTFLQNEVDGFSALWRRFCQ